MAFDGFNSSNVFGSWDLNPLAAQSGTARDDLANQRDSFLAPKYSQYRQLAAHSGGAFNADEGDQNLFNDSGFQNWVQTGQAPQASGGGSSPFASTGGSPTNNPQTTQLQNQMNDTQQQQQGQNQQRNNDLYNTLLNRSQQSLNLNANDPVIAAQTNAYRAEQTRGARNTMNQTAEAGGPMANLAGQNRMANEHAAQATGNFQSQLLGRELQSRRDEIQSSLAGMGGILSQDQQENLQRQLGLLDQNIKSRGLDIQSQLGQGGLNNNLLQILLGNDQSTARLGLDAQDRARYWDYQENHPQQVY
jgi:hypothetical protein